MIKLFASLAFLLSAHFAFAQSTIEWQRCYGGTGSDYLNDLKHVQDGGYIATGSVNAVNGDISGPAKGSQDIWLLKTDVVGAIEWDTTLGGSSIEVGRAIMPTPDGGFLLAAQTISNDGDIVGSKGLNDYWIVKLTAAGAILWARCYGGSDSDIPLSIAITADSNYAIAGNTRSNNGDVSGNHGSYDYWLLKISAANGNIIWQHCYGGSGLEGTPHVAATTDGGFILCGTSSSANGDITVQYGGGDMWLVKTDSLGSLVWQKNIGGSGYDRAQRVIQTLDGGFAAVGGTYSNDHDIIGYKDSIDLFVAKLSTTGSIEWVKTLGGTRYDEGMDITQKADSTLVIVGVTNSSDGDVAATKTPQNDDIWLIELSNKGNLLSQRIIGGSQREMVNAIDKITDSTYMIGGTTSSSDGDAIGSGVHSASNDFWLVKFKIPLPVTVQAVTTNPTIEVFPTYTKDNVQVVFKNNAATRTIVLTNAVGRLIQQRNDVSAHETITLSNLSEGMYLLYVGADNKRAVYKIIYQP